MAFLDNDGAGPDGLDGEMAEHLAALERRTGQAVRRSRRDPLLVSVRSGAVRLDARHDGHDPQPRPERRGGRGPGRRRRATRGSPTTPTAGFVADVRRRGDGRRTSDVSSSARPTQEGRARRQARHRADRRRPAAKLVDEFKADYQRRRRQATSRRIRASSSAARSTPSSLAGTTRGRTTTADGRHLRRPRARPSTCSAMVFGNLGDDCAHRRRLHPQPGDRRARVLRRVPGQRPGRGRGGRHPHAAADCAELRGR